MRWTVTKRSTLNVGCTILWIVVIVNKQKKANWNAALTSLHFLTVETMWPAASRSYSHDFLPGWAACSTRKLKQTLPSLRGFCEVCCHGVEKILTLTELVEPQTWRWSDLLFLQSGRSTSPFSSIKHHALPSWQLAHEFRENGVQVHHPVLSPSLALFTFRF